MNNFTIVKAYIIIGLTVWFSSIVFNNITDPGTNAYNINTVLTMKLLKNDLNFGHGLIWRAWPDGYGMLMLRCIIVYQIIIVISLINASYKYVQVILGKVPEIVAVKSTNIALMFYSFLWFSFLTGGTWFAYWIKQGAFCGVHSNLLMFSVILFIFFNFNVQDNRS